MTQISLTDYQFKNKDRNLNNGQTLLVLLVDSQLWFIKIFRKNVRTFQSKLKIVLDTKFSHKQNILNFWAKFARKGYFEFRDKFVKKKVLRSKTKKGTSPSSHEYVILYLHYIILYYMSMIQYSIPKLEDVLSVFL